MSKILYKDDEFTYKLMCPCCNKEWYSGYSNITKLCESTEKLGVDKWLRIYKYSCDRCGYIMTFDR